MEDPMPAVVITCPNTGDEVKTGIEMPSEAFEHATLRDNTLDCPACGQIHDWSMSDARLADEEGQ
jgi:predicted RNA-binding Zn-ribbon protein involved in translation (DUF1610 family)